MLRNIVLKFLTRVARDDEGLTSVEYAVLGAMVVAALVAATSFSTELTAAFNDLIKPPPV
ncbi:hypothetical protein [Inquilinus sp. CA228]|uniref:hypothetical protein n=1 Tax=Inquilinus sp. CA228 TaxID=3455609 RepID=UPI003F8D440D